MSHPSDDKRINFATPGTAHLGGTKLRTCANARVRTVVRVSQKRSYLRLLTSDVLIMG